jgi:virginiamycin B lyase
MTAPSANKEALMNTTVFLRSAIGAVAALTVLAACGKGTPLTAGTASPPPPFNPQVTSEYAIPTKNSVPLGITLGTDGNIWFTEQRVGKIGELDESAKFTETVTPTAKSQPTGIASGPNGLVWFTERNVGKVGQIQLTGPTFVDFKLPNPAARPVDIALGSDGNMWVTDPGANVIWRVNQKGLATSCKLQPNAQPLAIASGPDGGMWFTEPGTNSIGRMSVTDPCASLSEIKIPTANAFPAGITPGTDNALWFTEEKSDKLGRISVTGQVTDEFPLTPAISPVSVVQGIDGNFYFTDPGSNSMAQFKYKTHAVRIFKIPTANSQPTALTLGPDEQVYFVETAADQLGQFKYF